MSWIEFVEATLSAAGIYLGLGLVFAPFFLARGASRIDPVAASGSWGFKLVILPGVVWLWPLLAWKWARGDRAPREEQNAHRARAREAGR